MKTKPVITFRNIAKTEAVEKLIQEKIKKIDELCDTITNCRVIVEKPQKHQRNGRPFQVRIEMTVPPNQDIIINRDANRGQKNTTIAAEIRNAFQAAQRQLKRTKAKQLTIVKKEVY